MGRGDNKRSKKMLQRKAWRKNKDRLKRKASAGKTAAGTKPAAAPKTPRKKATT